MERRFIGVLTKRGNKARARRIFYEVMSYVSITRKMSTGDIIAEICEKVAPVLDFYRVKKGASIVNYPRLIADYKSKSLAVHWIVKSALLRPERTIEVKLRSEILDLLNDQGKAFSKKHEFHKKAVSTRFALKEKVAFVKRDEELDSMTDMTKKFLSSYKVKDESQSNILQVVE